jgi:LmbE family N-acetylglucosaminyl deacetylase
MLKLQLDLRRDRVFKILCLGAHSDDIEIGCGGTILKLVQEYENTVFHWVVLSSDERRKREAVESANVFLAGAKEKAIVIKGFKDGFFPYVGGEIKDYFEGLKREVDPDLIFTHHRLDLHQDHRLVSELTWNTFRDHLILEYEIPKYDGDLGAPSFFVHLDEPTYKTKLRNIFSVFKTQAENNWFAEETFQSIARLRGIESNALSNYAEAFYSRKVVLG